MIGEHHAVVPYADDRPVTPLHPTAITKRCSARTVARTVENSAAYVMPHLAPGVSILDAVGCGPGTITRDFAALVAARPGDRRRQRLGGDRSGDCGSCEPGAHQRQSSASPICYALEFADDTFDIVHRASSAPTHPRSGRRPARDATRVQTGRHRGRARRRLRRVHVVSRRAVARRVAGHVLAGRGPLQQGRARRGPIPPCVGARRGLHRHRAGRIHLVLRHARRPRLVGHALGGPHHRIRDHRPRPSSSGLRAPTRCRRWPKRGAPGPPNLDGWYAVLHGEILARKP